MKNTMKNYQDGQEYIFNVETEQQFNQLIGELVMDNYMYEISGFVTMFDKDDTPIIEGHEIFDIKAIWKYRNFITSFTVGTDEYPSTIFWINLES